MERLTRYICDRAHGAEGTSSEHLTGVYCRGEFEATALVERLAAIEDILGDDYDLDHLWELLNACKGLEPGENEESKLIIATRKDTEKLRRMAELVEADRDGRCVVLPQGGYTDEDGENALKSAMNTCFYHNNPVTRYIADAVAEKLTREAAEAALKGDNDG